MNKIQKKSQGGHKLKTLKKPSPALAPGGSKVAVASAECGHALGVAGGEVGEALLAVLSLALLGFSCFFFGGGGVIFFRWA